nr:hypothetical protein [Tanacetum cinerariifolium]
RCGIDLLNGFCPLCNSTNSCVYDPNPNSFNCPPDSYHPPQPTYETYSDDSCGNDSHFGTDCPPRSPLNYEPEPGYIQNYNSYPHDSPSFPQQYLCYDNCGGPHETFQCQPINQNFYNSNSSGFDQPQPPQSPVIHPPPQETSIEILYDQENAINSVQTFLRKFNRISFFETPNVLLLAWDKVFKIKDALGNKQYKPEDTQELFRELFNDVQNIHEELADMGNEHLDTIPKKESDEFIKSSVENLVPMPSESEDFSDIESECDMPDCDDSQTINFSTFSNPLFDDSTSSDGESSHEEVIHEISFKTDSNSLFDLDEEIISSEFNPIHNEDLDSTLKNDRFDTKSYLLESLLNRDESIPSGIDCDDSDSEGDNLFLERLLHDDPIPLPDTLDFSNAVRVFLPFFTYPVTSSILLSSWSEDTIFDPGISNYHFSS